ncbi:MAG: hypothetical protein AAGH15_22480 [Myxococcota bacterium]
MRRWIDAPAARGWCAFGAWLVAVAMAASPGSAQAQEPEEETGEVAPAEAEAPGSEASAEGAADAEEAAPEAESGAPAEPAPEPEPDPEFAVEPAPEPAPSADTTPFPAGANDAELGAPDANDPSQSGLLTDEQALFEEETGGGEMRSRVDPYEDPDETYVFLGAFYRATWTPNGLLRVFADDAPRSIYNPAVGVELIIRKKGFDIIPSLFLQGYRTQGPYRGRGDELTDQEIIISDLNAFMGGLAFLWSVEFNKYVSFQYGFDLGFGVTYGDLNRTEAYPTDLAPDAIESETSYDGWSPCPGPTPSDPRRVAYCGPVDESEGREIIRDPITGEALSNADGSEGEHYGINVRRWSDGGGLPNVWFRLALPHLAIRFKPIKQVMVRVDAGFDLFSGPFVGVAGHVGF